MNDKERKLYETALDIYFAGHWECDTLTKEESAVLFYNFRKALEVTKGHKLIHLSMGG